MSLKLVIGPSGSGKTTSVYDEFIKKSMEHPERNYLIIVPEQFTMQTQKDIVMRHPNKGIMNIDVLSFGRLSHRIFDACAGNQKTILDDTGKSLILRKIASDKEKELNVLGGNLHKLGYINEVKSVITEFIQYDIGKQELNQIIKWNENKPSLQFKLKDIGILYEGFLEYIHDNYITSEELLDSALKQAEKAEFLLNSELVFDGFTGFTPVQYRFLQKLMTLSRRVTVTILMGSGENYMDSLSEQKLFYLSGKTIETLNKLAREIGIKKENDTILDDRPVKRFPSNPGLSFLEENIFRYHREVFQKEQDSIEITEMQNPLAEANWVGKKITELVREKGYRYQEIAILTGNSEAYERVLRSELLKYQIPYFMDATRGILLNPFTEFIRASLEVITNNFTYESVFRYLRTGITDFEDVLIDEVENYVRASGIRGINKYREPWSFQYGDLTEVKLAELNQFREKFVGDFEILLVAMSNTRKETGLVLTKSLFDFILSQNLQNKLKVYENQFREEGNLAKAREYSQIYATVLDLFDQIVELLGKEKMTLKEFSDILDAGFAEIRVGIIPSGVDQVVVGDMQRTRLKDIKALFLMGVNDGYIPPKVVKGGIISEMDREMIRSQDVELSPTTRQQAYIQKMYLYLYLTKPKEKLFLSYSLVGTDGTSLRPSYLITTISKMYPKLTIKHPEETSSYQSVVTEQEGLERIVFGMQKEQNEEYLELYRFYKVSEEYHELVEKLTEAAFECYRAEPIAKAVATILYGKILENSVTRLEQFAACAYAHFLTYGLKLKEREEYSFESKDLGTIFHGVLEEYSRLLTIQGFQWFTITGEQSDELLETAMDTIMMRMSGSVLYSSARNEYMFVRIKRILKRTIKSLTEQVKKGVFMPNEYEVLFQAETDLSTIDVSLSEDEILKMKGRIDRLDTYETDDKVYVKVIDYKSGNKSFDLLSVYYGLQLQLVVYLNQSMEIEKKKHPEKEIIPAGVLYYHIDDPMIDREGLKETDINEINQRIQKELSMKGLINGEPEIIRMMDKDITGKSEIIPVSINKDGSVSKTSSVASGSELQLIGNYVNQKVRTLGQEIVKGTISINPYELSGKSACDYCGYRGICGFENGRFGFESRKLEPLVKEEVMNRLKGEIES
ncbi:MAG: helicase-exonuclease AddAB subunit AddB [Lachnospiraceae bacterium]|nr:helicase-exonuclease AddAB subunit AddB [Lachnospiraceae bacterium]